MGTYRFAAFLLALVAPLALGQVALTPAMSLLSVMRVDDQLSSQVRAILKQRCASAPPEQRDGCAQRSQALLQDLAQDRQLAQRMAPFMEKTYTGEEIRALTAFFQSPDGKALADNMVVLAAGRIEPNPPVIAKPLDAATQARLNAFLSSGVGLKFTQQAQPYKAELDRQSGPYLCAKFVRHGFARSCAEMGIPER